MAQQHVSDALVTGHATFGALGWLMPSHLELIAAVLHPDQGWSVDQHVSYDGTVVTMVTQSRTGRVFTLSGAGGRITLAQMHDDQLTEYDTFADMPSALDRVATLAREQV